MRKHRMVQYSVLVASGTLSFALATTVLTAQNLCTTGVCVLTWQNDQGRTGNNLNEGTLTSSVVGGSGFGQLCSVALDGQVFGQPLVVTNVVINSVQHNYVVYVVTQNDSLYAIDGHRRPAATTPARY